MNNLISVGFGREAAFAAALLGDNALMEKSWQDTGMLAEAVLHAHVRKNKRLTLTMHFHFYTSVLMGQTFTQNCGTIPEKYDL